MSSRSSEFCRKGIAAKRHKKEKTGRGKIDQIGRDELLLIRSLYGTARDAGEIVQNPFLRFLCLFAAILFRSKSRMSRS
jgi:hypothetical protein